MKHSQALRAVDDALAAARSAAAEAKLPNALRARILAATGRVAQPAPRGRMIDFVLRAAAVAAAILAVMFVMPPPIEAAEFDPAPFLEWNARVGETVAGHLAAIEVTDAGLAATDPHVAWTLGLFALLLVGVGLRFARRERIR